MSTAAGEVYQRFNPKLAWVGKALDALFPILALLFNRWDEDPTTSSGLTQPHRILLLESHLIGDTVLASSLLMALRARFPEAEIHVLGNPWAEDLLGGLGIADRFMAQKIPWALYDYSWGNLNELWAGLQALRLERYDLAIDPRGDARNAFLLWVIRARRRLGFACTGGRRFLTDVATSPPPRVALLDAKFAVLEPLGIPGPPLTPRLIPESSAMDKALQIMASLRTRHPGPWVGFHPGASQPQRKWSLGKQISLLHALAAAGFPVLLLGTAAERPELEEVARRSGAGVQVFTAGLPEAMALLGQLDALIGMDSGPAHIAAALRTPLVVIVEPQKAGITTPRGVAGVEWVTPRSGAAVEAVATSDVIERLQALLGHGNGQGPLPPVR